MLRSTLERPPQGAKARAHATEPFAGDESPAYRPDERSENRMAGMGLARDRDADLCLDFHGLVGYKGFGSMEQSVVFA
jgi:hypothetical protein